MMRLRTWLLGLCLLVVIALITALRLGRTEEQKPGLEAKNAAGNPTIVANAAAHRRALLRRFGPSIRDVGNRPEATSADGRKGLTNELVVILKPGVTSIDELASPLGAQVTGRLDRLGAYRLQFGDGTSTEYARRQLASDTDVESVDSNYAITRPPAGTEVAASTASQSGVTVRAGDSGGKTIVGLIDTAVQIESSGLDSSLFLSSLSVAGESGQDTGTISHGTSMAETILQGLSSVETGQDETSVRILSVDVYGNSETTTTYQIAEGVLKAVENGATIINLSMGTESDSTLLREVIESAHAQGVLFLGAAGNEPVTTATYPAAYSEVVAVTATDSQGSIASYANYGDFVDIATPGSVVVTFNGKQYVITGTSASTALASGAAAAIAEKTGASIAEVEAAIREGLTVQ